MAKFHYLQGVLIRDERVLPYLDCISVQGDSAWYRLVSKERELHNMIGLILRGVLQAAQITPELIALADYAKSLAFISDTQGLFGDLHHIVWNLEQGRLDCRLRMVITLMFELNMC